MTSITPSKRSRWLLLIVLAFAVSGVILRRNLQPVNWRRVAVFPKKVPIPRSNLIANVPALREVRLWGNAVEMDELFRHRASICFESNGKVVCQDLKQPSPH